MVKLCYILLYLLIECLLIHAFALAQKADNRSRALQLDDLFSLEGMGLYYGGPYAFSPDGESVAFVRVRPEKTAVDFSKQYLFGATHADIWIQPHPKTPAIRLTDGNVDGSGWWAPLWSPSGQYMAMLSTRGGNVTLWVKDFKNGEIRQLSKHGVDVGEAHQRPYLWLDSQHILVQILPGNLSPAQMRIDTDTPQLATAGWDQQRVGKRPTDSVLNSGGSTSVAARDQGQLEIISVSDGSVQIISDDNTVGLSLSPTKRLIAYARQTSVYSPTESESLPFGDDHNTYMIVIKDLSGKDIVKSTIRDILPDSIRWSPNGRQVAFLGYPHSHDMPLHLYKVDYETGRTTDLSLDTLDAVPIVRSHAGLQWADDSDVILFAAATVGGKKVGIEARRDWWLLRSDGREFCLTGGLAKTPLDLWHIAGQSAFVGFAGGRLWRVTPQKSASQMSTRMLSGDIREIVWPVANDPTGTKEISSTESEYKKIVVSAGPEADRSLYSVNLISGAVSPVAKPSKTASLDGFDARFGTFLFVSSDQDGTFLWRSQENAGSPDQLLEMNTFLSQIKGGELKTIQYTSLDGESLKATVILPWDYECGRHYPTVTFVYPGLDVGDHKMSIEDVTFYSPLNLQILAAHDYVVVIPSMPLLPEGEIDDPMLRLTNGVIPAVNKTIELGFSDPDRLFLMGQSFGGYAVYGLVTQTKRFKAAVSLAGISDLVSLYGVFDARARYGQYPHEDLFIESLMETAQIRMGVPPWKDLGRYIRNSPIFYIDRVHTPVLIIQGDLDYISMQQGEEFFRGLYRQGKTARFVRYWGEDHILASPANIRDMWHQIFDWLNEFDPDKRKTVDGTLGK